MINEIMFFLIPLAVIFLPFIIENKKRKNNTSTLKELTKTAVQEELVNAAKSPHETGHTHNRLDIDCYRVENNFDHYKRNLDDLEKAGILTRTEKNILLGKFFRV